MTKLVHGVGTNDAGQVVAKYGVPRFPVYKGWRLEYEE